jgi:hypothetical protein
MTKGLIKETDYLIVGAGAMGLAFADELFEKRSKVSITIVDRRKKAGGHWNNAYPFVRLHQPAAFYGVNSLVLGNGTSDLSSKSEILNYYEKVIAKFKNSGRVEFLAQHNYLGNGKVVDINNPERITTYIAKNRVVDATYMKVKVPSTHKPKYDVEQGVPLIPINDLTKHYDKWENFYVIGNGKTGMDAVLYLLEKGVPEQNIYWVCPNQAWLFSREDLQVGNVANVVLKQAEILKNTASVDEFFLALEGAAGIIRLHENSLPKKWRCATISPQELEKLRRIENLIEKGRVQKITKSELILNGGSVGYGDKTLFVDCSANALSREKKVPIFSEGKITLQPILFCQQVFSAATIARMELTNLSDEKRNKLIPIPHPEFKEDWPSALTLSIENLLLLHRHFPLWMFRSRLNFMSHETALKYIYYSIKAILLSPSVNKNACKLDEMLVK